MQVLRGRRHRVEALAFSHCGRWLAASGSYNGGVHVWDTANPTAKPLVPAVERPLWISGLAFQPDGSLFFAARHNEWFRFDPAANVLTEYKRAGAEGRFVPTADARHGIRADSHQPLQYWSVPTADGAPAKRLWTARSASWSYGAAAFARDGLTVATSEIQGPHWLVGLRDAATGERRGELTAPNFQLPQLSFSATGEHLVGRGASSLMCWTLATPDKKPHKVGNPTRRHFQAMTVHPSGPVLTVDNDRLVRVWEVPTLEPYRTIEWSVGKLYAVAVSPDGARAAVGSHTGAVLVWDWD